MLHIYKEYEDAVIPTKNNDTDAGYDLYAYEDKLIKSGSRVEVSIGVRVVVERGYWFTHAPRSGLAFKSNIIPSHLNVMDSYYTGDNSVLLYNRSDNDYIVKKGDKICQLLVFKTEDLDINIISKEELNTLSEGNRGSDGFGSSGK